MNVSPLIDSWQIHNRINTYLLQAIAPEHLQLTFQNKGRTVASQFAHIHNVRLMWLKASAPELMQGQTKIETTDSPTHEILVIRLQESADAIALLLQQGLESGRIKGFKPHAEAFFAYLVSHESHHRGQIMLTLKSNGHAVDKKIQFGIWEWGVR